MMPALLVLIAALGLLAPQVVVRKPAPVPLRVDAPLPNVSGAGELPDGRILITDFRLPAVYLLVPSTGALTKIGAAGVGPNQYIQPGGLYAGAGGTTLILDRSQARVLVVSPAGQFVRTYSIAVKGTSSSSDLDLDRQHLDAHGLAYFTGRAPDSVALLRFDAATQKSEVIAHLLAPQERTMPGGDGVTYSRIVIGSPADGWGVTPDGRVALVRAVPYRVEWMSPAGKVTRGPVVEYTPLPMTDADKQAFVAAHKGGSVGAGMAGATSNTADIGPLFAATKPPFDRDAVIVSPEGHVWVMRTAPAAVREVTYDVFDETGTRIDRVEFPALSRVIGFGKASVFVREGDGTGPVALKKYKAR